MTWFNEKSVYFLLSVIIFTLGTTAIFCAREIRLKKRTTICYANYEQNKCLYDNKAHKGQNTLVILFIVYCLGLSIVSLLSNILRINLVAYGLAMGISVVIIISDFKLPKYNIDLSAFDKSYSDILLIEKQKKELLSAYEKTNIKFHQFQQKVNRIISMLESTGQVTLDTAFIQKRMNDMTNSVIEMKKNVDEYGNDAVKDFNSQISRYIKGECNNVSIFKLPKEHVIDIDTIQKEIDLYIKKETLAQLAISEILFKKLFEGYSIFHHGVNAVENKYIILCRINQKPKDKERSTVEETYQSVQKKQATVFEQLIKLALIYVKSIPNKSFGIDKELIFDYFFQIRDNLQEAEAKVFILLLGLYLLELKNDASAMKKTIEILQQQGLIPGISMIDQIRKPINEFESKKLATRIIGNIESERCALDYVYADRR